MDDFFWDELFFLEFSDPNNPDASEDDEEEEEYSMDDEGEEAPAEETPDNAQEEPVTEEEPEEEEEYSMDDVGEEPEETSEETPDNEPATEEPAEGEEPEEEEEYEIPDDDAEGEPAEGGEGEAPAEGDDTGEDEEYSMDDVGGDSGEGEDGGTGDGTDFRGESEPVDDTPDTKLKELESVIFDELTEEEKKLKIKELKELYVVVYKKCGTISDMLTDIKRDEETIQIVEYISNTLIDLKQYVDDYINDVFESKTYIENLSQLQKYIAIFTAINKVFEQIKQENEE